MSQYYNPRRTRNMFDPTSIKPFPLSRSKIDLFLECPRCFYLDRRRGVSRPPGFPFSLNSAVDALLKKEFDAHRAAQTPHPLMEEYTIDAVPFAHADIDQWRENFQGIRHHHEPTHFLVTGAIDDVWRHRDGALHIVDYKSTSKQGEVNLDAPWQDGYKRQMEVYQWLFRRNGYDVSDVGYFVYCNGDAEKEQFGKRLEFDIRIIPYQGDDAWIEETLHRARACLTQDALPDAGSECDYCAYRDAVANIV